MWPSAAKDTTGCHWFRRRLISHTEVTKAYRKSLGWRVRSTKEESQGAGLGEAWLRIPHGKGLVLPRKKSVQAMALLAEIRLIVCRVCGH